MPCARLEELPDPPESCSTWPWEKGTGLSLTNGTEWPKISIVTPSYNQGQYIEETIRSILLQGYPNLEYIVMDGESTDETVDVIKKYEPWIDYWESESDEGQSHAINKGLEKCTGDIWNWINSDDLLEPGALWAIAENVGDHDVLIGRARHFTEEESHVKEADVEDFSPEPLLRAACQFSQEAVWLKLDQVKALGGVDETFHYSMDRELYVRYTYHYPNVKGIEDILGRFRAHDASKSVQSGFDSLDNAFRRDYLRMARKLRDLEEYEELHRVCDQRIEWLEWLLYIGKLQDQKERPVFSRLAELFGRALQRPGKRINRFTLGAARRLWTGAK
jgi:glycosyltransferase involved in cell wall biosynthesis